MTSPDVLAFDDVARRAALRFTSGALRPEREDALQAARVGLVVAARRFDPARGLAFKTYARWCCTQAVYQWRREVLKNGLVGPAPPGGWTGRPVLPFAEGVEPAAEDLDDAGDPLPELPPLDGLPADQRAVIELHYLAELDLRAVSRRLRIPVRQVNALRRAALAALRARAAG